MFGHGAQKLFGWFGGSGFAATRALFGGPLRLRPAGLWTLAGGASETGGGIFFALGLFEPLGAVAIIAAMLMAMALVSGRRGFWGMSGGIEPNLLYIVPALAEALTGPGRYALGAALGIALPAPATLLAGLALALLSIAVGLQTRAPAAHPVSSAAAAPAVAEDSAA
jgi:putative oxidoreductase